MVLDVASRKSNLRPNVNLQPRILLHHVANYGEQVADILNKWVRQIISAGQKPDMFRKHQTVLPMFLEFTGNKPINDLKQADINGFFALLEKLPPRWPDEVPLVFRLPTGVIHADSCFFR